MLLIVLVAGAGCGGSGDDAAPVDQSSAATTGDDGGSAGAAVDEDGLPDSVRADFPAAISGGWEIDILGELGMTDATGAQLLYPADAYDGLVAFYDEWTGSQAEEYARTESGDQVIYTGTGSVYSITITPSHQERDRTWTLLQIVTPGS